MNANYHRGLLKTLSIFALTFAACLLVNAQSGRRSTSKPTTPAPPVSEPKPAEKVSEKVPKIEFLVGIDDPSIFSNTHHLVTDLVLRACVQRLDESAEVHATGAVKRMNRVDAAKAAKEEKTRYVVWLQLGSDVIDSGRQSTNGADELYVNYLVLEPVTAKVKHSGRTYTKNYKVGGVGVSIPGTRRDSPTYSEYQVKQTGREAAEKILEAFAIKISDRPWPL